MQQDKLKRGTAQCSTAFMQAACDSSVWWLLGARGSEPLPGQRSGVSLAGSCRADHSSPCACMSYHAVSCSPSACCNASLMGLRQPELQAGASGLDLRPDLRISAGQAANHGVCQRHGRDAKWPQAPSSHHEWPQRRPCGHQWDRSHRHEWWPERRLKSVEQDHAEACRSTQQRPHSLYVSRSFKAHVCSQLQSRATASRCTSANSAAATALGTVQAIGRPCLLPLPFQQIGVHISCGPKWADQGAACRYVAPAVRGPSITLTWLPVYVSVHSAVCLPPSKVWSQSVPYVPRVQLLMQQLQLGKPKVRPEGRVIILHLRQLWSENTRAFEARSLQAHASRSRAFFSLIAIVAAFMQIAPTYSL